MKPEYKCNECGRIFSLREYEKQSDIFCPDCGGHIEEYLPKPITQADTFSQVAKQPLSHDVSTNPLLIKCESCSRQFSKRAQQCPQCGWKSSTICKVCQQKIPSDSTSCPECGDPEPFDSNHASRVVAELGVSKNTGIGVTADAPLHNNPSKDVESVPIHISDRPLKNIFSFFGLFLGAGLSKFLSKTFIGYPTFTDPHTAGLTAAALTVIVIFISAWLHHKLGRFVAAKINAGKSTKGIKTSIAWGLSIVSFILYLAAAGLLSEFSPK